ncbi:SCO family protein [Pseudomonas stutzeri]|nr:SCO family protein [Stutzerimonas stutzeri]
MHRTHRPGLSLSLAGLLALGAAPALASDPHAGHPAAAPRAAESARVQLAEAWLIDQHERPQRLREDVVGERIVVIGFVYTSCTTVCPVVSAIMQKLQTALGARAGGEVQLVSLSVDPLRDTPQRLREQAERYRAGPGWSWLTGSLPAVTAALQGFGAWSADFAAHPPLIMVGDGRSGEWRRYYGFADPAVLLARVDALAAARARHGAHAHAMQGEARP